MTPKLLQQCVAEFVGTFALIFIGVGVIANHSDLTGNAGLLAVALAHGLTIAVMVSATGAISGDDSLVIDPAQRWVHQRPELARGSTASLGGIQSG